METGDALPTVELTDSDDNAFTLRDRIGGGGLVVYFYPKADTSGCTREAQDFSALAQEFADAGIAVIGVSRDTPAKLARFAAKHGLTVPLVSDTTGDVCAAFGVWGEKKLYGKIYMGIERATFAFGPNGTLRQAWRKVKVPGHAATVLATLTGVSIESIAAARG